MSFSIEYGRQKLKEQIEREKARRIAKETKKGKKKKKDLDH